MKRKKIVIIGATGTALNIIGQVIDAGSNYDQPVESAGITINFSEKCTLFSGIPVSLV